MKTIILGPPGTGKTTTLLNLVDEFIQDGVRPKQIGYFSFTKKAANEAADRAAEKFGLDKDNDLPFFRTLHSYLDRNVAYQSRQQSIQMKMELLILTMNILQS